MKTVTVPAIKSFTYQGQAYRRGDLVVMSPVDAATESRRGHVSLTRGHQAKVEAPAPTPQRRRARKSTDDGQTYRRRDLVAEGAE